MRTWQVDEGKFLSEAEVNRLTGFLKHRSNYNGGRVAVNDWLVIDLALSTGLRVSEIANLRCGDIWVDPVRAEVSNEADDGWVPLKAPIGNVNGCDKTQEPIADAPSLTGRASLIVRNGKNGKQRIVKFSDDFRRHLNEYLEWKKMNGQDCGPESPLILSSNTMDQMTTRALQKAFERNAKRVGIEGHSIHSLRHTYATFLLRASGNLRLVQKQLGHSSITTTEVYADVLNPELDRALAKLYLPR